MKHSESNNKKDEKSIDTNSLTDYDLCELHIRCHEVLFEISSRLDIESHRSFELAQVLWKKTIEARDEYRKSNPFKQRNSND